MKIQKNIPVKDILLVRVYKLFYYVLRSELMNKLLQV